MLAVASPMRVAQFVVPGPGGDAEMGVFRFAGGAGGVDANIARWKGQFVPPEGKTVDDIQRDTDRDYFMDAFTAKSYGLIDEVLVRSRPALPK